MCEREEEIETCHESKVVIFTRGKCSAVHQPHILRFLFVICRYQMFLNVAASSRPKVQIKNAQKLNINLSFVAYFETGSVLTV